MSLFVMNMNSGPIIPLRTSVRTSLSNPATERKRRSLPASPQKDSRRSSNHVSVKPASTEVISSLIDTLSALSSPVQDHFDLAPDGAVSLSTPVSPSPWAATFTGVGGGRDRRSSAFLHPERASLRGSDQASRRSSKGSHAKASEDEFSIGNVSVEHQNPIPGQSSSSLVSLGSERGGRSLRSIRSLKSLGWKGSKESLSARSGPKQSRDLLISKKQRTDMGDARDRLVIAGSRSPSPSLEHSDSLVVPKRPSNRVKPDLVISPRRASTQRDSRRLFLNGDESSDGAISSKRNSFHLPSQDLVPKRNSSIRNSRLVNPQDRARRSLSVQTGTDDPLAIETAAQEAANADLALLSPDADLSVLSDNSSFRTAPATPVPETTEEEVVQRIKELREQKEQRARLSMGDGPDDLAPPSASTRTPSPMAIHTPTPDIAQVPKNEMNGALDTPEVKSPSPPLLNEASPAPPPTIPSTARRPEEKSVLPNKSVVGNGIPPPAIPRPRPNTPNDNNRTSSLTSPQRRNSKLQKRLSTPTGPDAEQKHRRRFSTPVPPIARLSTLQPDGEHPVDDAVEKYIAAPRLSQKVKTQTGRVISFSEVGDANGSVVFCCVGMGLTRYLTAFYDELAASLSLRLITPDRPGVGGSESHADGNDTPLGWPDDVRLICEHLRITKFSILAHSAGAIYALATALRMPQHIRCRVHLLAPWIPPSQMSAIGTHQEPLPSSALPYSQRLLRSLPTPFLRVANSSWLSFTSNSVTTSLPRTPKQRTKRRGNSSSQNSTPTGGVTPEPPLSVAAMENGQAVDLEKENLKPPILRRGTSAFNNIATDSRPDLSRAPTTMDQVIASQDAKDKDPDYKNRLTSAIWEAATTNANAAVDLIVCLERKQPIGFRYVDITRAVVIHHGSKDNRVPVENVKWLGNLMRRCEVRVLEGEGHGLMASAGVMGNVLEEMSREWEDWLRVVRGKRGGGPVSP